MNNDDKVNYDGNEHVASWINERNDRWSKVEEEEEVESKMIPRQYSSTVQYGMLQYGMIQYGMVQYGTLQYGTVQYGTVQYGTVRYNAVQYSEVK